MSENKAKPLAEDTPPVEDEELTEGPPEDEATDGETAEAEVVPDEEEGETLAPLTRDEFRDEFRQLASRLKAAGLSPAKVLISEYAKRGMDAVEGFLSGLEGKRRDSERQSDDQKES